MKEVGTLLLYDPNLRPPLWPSPEAMQEQILSIWDQACVIKVREVKLEFLVRRKGSSSPEGEREGRREREICERESSRACCWNGSSLRVRASRGGVEHKP